MTSADFTTALLAALQASGRPFNRGYLPVFVERFWPWMANDLDAARWASEFLEQHADGAGGFDDE